MAAVAGIGCDIVSMKAGMNRNKHKSYASNWSTNIDGKCAEMAVAKFSNVYWGGNLNTFKGPDVANKWQVRSHRQDERIHNPHLIIRPDDLEVACTFIFVVTRCPYYDIMGTFGNMEASAGGTGSPYWRSDKDGWWVPISDLCQDDFRSAP